MINLVIQNYIYKPILSFLARVSNNWYENKFDLFYTDLYIR